MRKKKISYTVKTWKAPTSIHRKENPNVLTAETTCKNPGPMNNTSRPTWLSLKMKQKG